MEVNLHSIVIFQLVFYISDYCTASCTYPSSWRRITWFHHYDDDLIKYLYSYEQNGIIKQLIRGANVPGLNIYFQCKKQVKLSDQRWYGAELMLQGNPTGHIQCMHIIPNVKVLLERPTNVASISQCPQEEDTVSGFNVMVPYPFDFSSGTCPFTSGTFHLTYNADSSMTEVCSGIAGSEVIINRKFININTCNPVENNYKKPYKASLRCVNTFSGDKIDSSANGDILILARQMASTTFFYCARYKIQDGNVYMSIDVTNRQTVNCLPGVSHLTFGLQGQHLHRGFIFSDMLPTTTSPSDQSTTGSTASSSPVTSDGPSQSSSRSQTVTSSTTSSSLVTSDGPSQSSSRSQTVTSSNSPPTTSSYMISSTKKVIVQTTASQLYSTSFPPTPNTSTNAGPASNSKSENSSSNLPLHIIIIISVLCGLAGLIVITVLISVAYCKIRNRKEEEERPPEITVETDIGPMIVALDNDNGSGVKTWYPEYMTNSSISS